MSKAPRLPNAQNHGTKAATGYRWMTKDPWVDKVLALCRQDGRSLSAIANAAYLSPTTLHNWDHGATRKPNNVSIDYTLRALGYGRELVKLADNAPRYRWRAK